MDPLPVDLSDMAVKMTYYTGARLLEKEGWLIDRLSSVLRPLQHSIGYMGDGFYGSKDPTNSITVLKEEVVKEKPQKTKKTQITHA